MCLVPGFHIVLGCQVHASKRRKWLMPSGEPIAAQLPQAHLPLHAICRAQLHSGQEGQAGQRGQHIGGVRHLGG